MEKFIRNLSTIITSILFYTIALYVYLTYKGFVYGNGTFTLVSPAYAAQTAPGANNIATPLEAMPALTLTNAESTGAADAPLTMYEFSSLGCGHCADFHLNILPKLDEDFVRPGKLKTVFVHFPLEKKSMQAAMLSRCVPADKRAEFINTVFAKQREWGLSYHAEKHFMNYAADAGLSHAEAETCLKNDVLAQEIIADRQEGINKLKMQGTPSFLISGKDGDEVIYGVPDYDELKSYLQSRLEN